MELCIVVRHRSTLRRTLDRQQRQQLFAHRAGRLGKRYGQIGISLVDGAPDRKRFFARLELVPRRCITDQFQLHSDGTITCVRGIKRPLGGKVCSFRERIRIFAICETQRAERNRAAVRRAVIAAANGIGPADAPDLRPRVRFGVGLFAFARVG